MPVVDSIHTAVTLKTKILQSLSILILREFCIKLLAFAGQLFLSRLLAPQHFGTFAMIAFVVNFGSLFADIGLQWSVIQRQQAPSQQELSSIFILKSILSLIVIGVLIVAAPILKLFYSSFDETNIMMVQVFAVTIIITALRSVPAMLLERNLKYHALSITEVSGVFVYQVVAIVLAMSGMGTWSLIWGVICKEVIEILVLYYFYPWIPSRTFSLSKLFKITHFGLFMQGNAIVNFIHSSLIPFFVGIIRGPYAVGILDWAQGIAALPNTITDNYGRVAFTGLAKFQDDRQLLIKAISKSMSILAILTLPFTIFILGYGRELVELLFTETWLPGVPVLYWFAANSFFVAVMSSLGAGILVTGHSKKILVANIITKIIEWGIVFALLPQYDYISIAIASTVASVLAFITYLFIAHRVHILPNIVSILLPKVLIVLGTMFFIMVVKAISPPNTLYLLINLVLTGFVYLGLVYVVSRNDLIEGLNVVKHYLHAD